MTSSILITLSTNHPTLSKSGQHAFSITLSATTDSDTNVITIDPFMTMLHSQMAVYCHQGFTFKSTSTGKLAPRVNMNVCFHVEDYLTPAGVIEIPPKGSDRPFSIVHTLDQSRVKQPREGEELSEMDQLTNAMCDDTVGLEVGKSYEIGLGEYWNVIKWWKAGNKSEVFEGQDKLYGRWVKEGLSMSLQNKVVIEIVE